MSKILFLLGIFAICYCLYYAILGIIKKINHKPARLLFIKTVVTGIAGAAFFVAGNATITPEEIAAMHEDLAQREQSKQEKAKIEQDAKNIADKSSENTAKDFNNAIVQTQNELLEKKYFPFVNDIKITVNNDKKEINMMAIVAENTSSGTVLNFSDIMIRRFGLYASDKDSKTSEDYYGSIYDTYAIHIGIAQVSKSKNEDDWLINSYIRPGMHTKEAPKLKK